jgi:predicted RNA-binding Zn-ribbon protein involved in translation (DUF1610 family)
MNECYHKNLVLIAEASEKVRCTRCHLTLTPEELGDSYCPECYETSGKKQYEFEAVQVDQKEITRYRCEDCGTIIETNNK